MDWQMDPRSRTLRIDLAGGSSPSREEVDRFLQKVAPVFGRGAVRRISLNGQDVARRRNLTVNDAALPLHYEAAQRRTLESWPSLWETGRRSAS